MATTIKVPNGVNDKGDPILAELDLSEYVKPGAPIPADVLPGHIRPTGKADGVIFLDGKRNSLGEEIVGSRRREAMRYLCRPTDEWYAANPGFRGRCKPDLWAIRSAFHNQQVSADIEAAAKKRGETVDYTFNAIERTINANQREHRNKFYIVPAEGRDDIWCVFYITDGKVL